MLFSVDSIDSFEPSILEVSEQEFEKRHLPHLELGSTYLVSHDGVNTYTPYDDEAESFVGKLRAKEHALYLHSEKQTGKPNTNAIGHNSDNNRKSKRRKSSELVPF